MKFIIFFICVPLVHSELHRFMTAYTEISNQTDTRIPELFAVTTLDDHQIDYYDSNVTKLIPRQDWMKEFESKNMWKGYTKIREDVQQIYKTNVHVLMKQFNNSPGVHTYQRMYGCEWDDETEETQGFDQYGYDGEDFISLDLKKLRYITPVEQGLTTVMKWNNDRTRLDYLKRYYDHGCVYWLKELLDLSKATLKKAEPPKVSLLPKKQGNCTCHVTGFLFRNTIISWRKNGQDLNNSSKLVKSGETLPNEDGTFQRTVTLYVPPDEWKKNHYVCEVEHKSLTETIQTILTENEIKSNSKMRPEPGSDASYNKEYLALGIIPVIAVPIVLFGSWLCWKHREKIQDVYNRKPIYFKNKSWPLELVQTLCRLISRPKEYSPPSELPTV